MALARDEVIFFLCWFSVQRTTKLAALLPIMRVPSVPVVGLLSQCSQSQSQLPGATQNPAKQDLLRAAWPALLLRLPARR